MIPIDFFSTIRRRLRHGLSLKHALLPAIVLQCGATGMNLGLGELLGQVVLVDVDVGRLRWGTRNIHGLQSLVGGVVVRRGKVDALPVSPPMVVLKNLFCVVLSSTFVRGDSTPTLSLKALHHGGGLGWWGCGGGRGRGGGSGGGHRRRGSVPCQWQWWWPLLRLLFLFLFLEGWGRNGHGGFSLGIVVLPFIAIELQNRFHPLTGQEGALSCGVDTRTVHIAVSPQPHFLLLAGFLLPGGFLLFHAGKRGVPQGGLSPGLIRHIPLHLPLFQCSPAVDERPLHEGEGRVVLVELRVQAFFNADGPTTKKKRYLLRGLRGCGGEKRGGRTILRKRKPREGAYARDVEGGGGEAVLPDSGASPFIPVFAERIERVTRRRGDVGWGGGREAGHVVRKAREMCVLVALALSFPMRLSKDGERGGWGRGRTATRQEMG